jgi:hypothetical protein
VIPKALESTPFDAREVSGDGEGTPAPPAPTTIGKAVAVTVTLFGALG